MPTTSADLIRIAHRKVGAALPDYLPDYANDLLRNGVLRMLNALSRENVDDTVLSRLGKYIVVDRVVPQQASPAPPNTFQFDFYRVKSVRINRVIDRIKILSKHESGQSGLSLLIELDRMAPGRRDITGRLVINGLVKDVVLDNVGYLTYSVRYAGGSPVGYAEQIGDTIDILEWCYVEAGNPATAYEPGSEATELFPRYWVYHASDTNVLPGAPQASFIRVAPFDMQIVELRATYVMYIDLPPYTSTVDLEATYPVDLLYLIADYIAEEYVLNANAYNKYVSQKGKLSEEI